jgi:SAM-dependent methyltransferase
MIEANIQTLDSYEQRVPEYLAGTSHLLSGPEKDWIDAVLNRLPRNAKVLEIGSGPGRDAIYIRKQGYAVICTDAAPAFVSHLRGLSLEAQFLNVLVDPVPSGYALILANSVLLHFNREQLATVLMKVANALETGAQFAFSLKRGDGEEWSSHKLNAPRFFCYWQPDALPILLAQAGFSDWSVNAVGTERNHADWLYIIAQK